MYCSRRLGMLVCRLPAATSVRSSVCVRVCVCVCVSCDIARMSALIRKANKPHRTQHICVCARAASFCCGRSFLETCVCVRVFICPWQRRRAFERCTLGGTVFDYQGIERDRGRGEAFSSDGLRNRTPCAMSFFFVFRGTATKRQYGLR